MIDQPRSTDTDSALSPGEEWVQLARDAFSDSTSYMQTNCHSRWKKALAHYQNQHAPGSKYHSEAYKGRARIFRPKTRSASLSQEASLAVAAFSTTDLAVIEPSNPSDPDHIMSAEICQALIQYRLDRRIPWFQTMMGAYQDTFNYGVCISRQWWDYEEAPTEDGMAGAPQVIKDDLKIDLICPENFRFAPAADWRNPVESSPYLIELIPMFVTDVQERMVSNGKEQPWFSYTENEIVAYGATKHADDTVRHSREGHGRTDPTTTHTSGAFSTVWVHRNIVRQDGEDWHYYTLGTERLLSIPVRLSEVSPLGRPYVIGHSILEAHKAFPAGGNELSATMQQEINDIANQRLDNVRLALNARYFFRRRRGIDLQALSRSKPGSAVAMDDPANDVVVHRPPEVTGSSYQEQSLLGVEMDEMLGNFSQSTVQSNRAMNETVGGMQMMQTGAGQVREYFIRIFMETWVEPVLRQCMKLIQQYETDSTIIALAANKSQGWLNYGQDADMDWLLTRDLVVKVNVGIGNTDPMQRVQKLTTGINTIASLPGMAERLANGGADQAASVIMGALGYGSAERFFPPPDPEAQPQPSPEQMEAEAKAQIEQMRIQGQMQIEQMRAQALQEIEMQKLQLSQQRLELDAAIQTTRVEQERELKLADIAARHELKVGELEVKVGIADQQNKTKRDVEALRGTLANNELSFKERTGQQGI